jgi:glycosyltransferase AglI
LEIIQLFEINNLKFKHNIQEGFISVVIPVYNDPDGLVDTLTSLRKQTLSKSQYEIIVANDGGMKEITRVCESFQIKEMKIEPNKGSYFARNRALEYSKGEYIAFVDADISVPPEWLETGRNMLHDSDYAGGPVIIDKNKIKTPADYYESIHGFANKTLYMENNFFVTANLFIKRIVIEQLGGFDERLKSGGDNELGKRVYYSGMFRQKYSEHLFVFHPPRGFRKLVLKRIRVLEGKMLLNKLYPDRYRYQKPDFAGLTLSLLTPPRLSSVKKVFRSNNGFSFLRLYMFIWKFKIMVSLKSYRFVLSKNHELPVVK